MYVSYVLKDVLCLFPGDLKCAKEVKSSPL